MNIDVENRVIAVLQELLLADSNITALTANRIYPHASQAHKAAYPCVTIQMTSCAPFGPKQGWYKPTVNLIAHTHIHDDKDTSTLRSLAGLIRGLLQDARLVDTMNKSAAAQTAATELTIMDVEIAGSFSEESDQNARTLGLEIMLVMRPSRGSNHG
jgi:hypothetical protein